MTTRCGFITTCLVLVGACGVGAQTPTSNAADGYVLVWADEFNRDGRPDPNNWVYEHGFERNEELQWYQPENAACKDGVLVIAARRERRPNPQYDPNSNGWRRNRPFIEYTSACIKTVERHSWTFGRFEMRGRIDTRPGMWPAFWTLGSARAWPGCGEIDIIDIECGVKLAGTRNYFLKGDGALLHWAVLRFAIDFMVGRGYTPMAVPLLMRDEAMRGTGYYPGSEEQTYRMERDELNLVGTAEVPLTAYRMGEILQEEELPLKTVGLSSCFRREAGAAGKDTYGLYRIHQFDKVEQVVVCRNSVEESNKYHAEILANAEGVLKALGLPYRVVVVCTGDLGRGQAKKYDIEAWMPSRQSYSETHSASKFYEFQARRMNLRYKERESKKNLFCHTLNNTVIASPRILIPILEMYQNADGSITVPEVLRPYMGGKETIRKG